MADVAREVIDGLWMIRQDREDRDVMIYYCGKLVKVKERDELLSLPQLRNELLMYREEAKEDE